MGLSFQECINLAKNKVIMKYIAKVPSLINDPELYFLVLFVFLHTQILACKNVIRKPKSNKTFDRLLKLKWTDKWIWMGEWEWDWLFNVTCNDISVIYVTAHRCAGGLKKLDLRSCSQCHRHFVRFFDVPIQAPKGATLLPLFWETLAKTEYWLN